MIARGYRNCSQIRTSLTRHFPHTINMVAGETGTEVTVGCGQQGKQDCCNLKLPENRFGLILLSYIACQIHYVGKEWASQPVVWLNRPSGGGKRHEHVSRNME